MDFMGWSLPAHDEKLACGKLANGYK